MIFLGGNIIPDAPTTAYANAGGTGDRSASITVTSVPAHDNGPMSNLVDGDFSVNTTGGIDMKGTGATAIANGDYFRFDFGAGVFKYIDEVKVYFNSGIPPNMGSWAWQGSDDATTWTTYGTFTWNAATKTVTLTGVSPYGHRYWQMVENDTGQVWTNSFFLEVEFKIATGAV